jgi:hypothetical protein
MKNLHIQSISNEFKHTALMAELGMEGFSTFTEFLSSFVSRMGLGKTVEAISSFAKSGTISATTRKVSDLDKVLSKTEYKAVENILVYQPVGFTDNLLPYATYLSDLLERMSDIDKRLLIPMALYLNKAVSVNDFSSKLWIDKNLKPIDVKSEVKVLSSFFDPKVNRNRDIDTVKFGEVFVSNKDVLKTGIAVQQGESVAKKIDYSKILQAEKDLETAINLYVKTAQEHPEIVTQNKHTIKQLAETVTAIANELELLSIANFNYITLQTAFNDSVDKLLADLK